MPLAKSNFKRKWIRATFIGWFLSIVLIIILSGIFEGAGIRNMQFFLGVAMGAGVGIMQWLVLRRAINMGTAWIWMSVTGIGLPFLFFDLLKYFGHIHLGEYYILYSVCMAGLLTGILQYPLLKKQVPKANLWIAASFTGWVAATLTFLSINYTRYLSHNNWVLFSVNLALILGGGWVLGIVTGLFWKWMGNGE